LRLSRLVFALVFATASSLTLAQAAHACAPSSACAGGICWYYLLNDDSFTGSTCTPGWVGASVINSNLCTDFWGTQYKVAQLTSSNPSITQSFTVPNTPGSIDVSLMFATAGTPTSSDRIYIELWEAGVLKETINVRTDLGPFYCHREDYSFIGSSYAGKTLDLRVRASIVTSGVSYHLDWITLFYQ
jgi:hypothetical protein